LEKTFDKKATQEPVSIVLREEIEKHGIK